MSTEQSVDPELLEQTKQQIRSLVYEIQQLAKSDIAPLEFYTEFLNRVVQALAANGGAVWTKGDEGNLALEYQINLQKSDLGADEARQLRHGRLLHKVVSSGEGMLVAPQSGAGDDQQAGNPTDWLLVLAPLKSDQEVRGVVEVFQRAESLPRTQRGYLRFLMQMCEVAGEFLKTRDLRHFTDRQVLWGQLESFTRMTHASLNVRETAFTVANEGRRLIGCDRVSVAIRRGTKYKVEAVSGQDLLDTRSNVVTMLGRLATAVVATGEPMWYTGDTSDLAPQVEEAVQAYVDESHSKTVAVLPLCREAPASDEHEEERNRPVPVGALIVEQIEDSRVRDGLLKRVEVVAQHSALALANAVEYHSLFLLPLWKTLGKATWVVRARTLPKTLAVAAAVVGVIAALILVPADFELEGNGSLQPVVRQDVFAEEDGTVVKVLVKHNQSVAEHDPLAEMQNTTLDVQIEEISGKLKTAHEDAMAARRTSYDDRTLDQAKRDELESRIRNLELLESSYREQISLLQKKKALLVVHSPISGKIVTSWDVLESLQQRPVKRGDTLMRVAEPEKDWELELLMPEDRMGHISAAQGALQKDLKVRYYLATDPGRELLGTIRDVHYSAEVREEEGNTVKVRVQINRDDLPEQLRPGAGVTARVYCGRRSVGYVWLHDVIDFIQSKILFRFF